MLHTSDPCPPGPIALSPDSPHGPPSSDTFGTTNHTRAHCDVTQREGLELDRGDKTKRSRFPRFVPPPLFSYFATRACKV